MISKKKLIAEISRVKKLKRELEDISKELDIEIKNDNIYISLKAYHAALIKSLEGDR